MPVAVSLCMHVCVSCIDMFVDTYLCMHSYACVYIIKMVYDSFYGSSGTKHR